MNEKLKLALEKLERNPELKVEVMKNPPKNAEEIIAIAARLGVELTKDDLKPQDKEMSLEDADQLAGGSKDGLDKTIEDCDVGMGVACVFGAGAGYWAHDI